MEGKQSNCWHVALHVVHLKSLNFLAFCYFGGDIIPAASENRNSISLL
jgi:hypothetical protein